jgi:threonine aldolase
LYEAGGVAMHSQASSHAVPPKNGHHLTLEDNCVFGEDIHSAPTKLVSLENTLSGSTSALLPFRPDPDWA